MVKEVNICKKFFNHCKVNIYLYQGYVAYIYAPVDWKTQSHNVLDLMFCSSCSLYTAVQTRTVAGVRHLYLRNYTSVQDTVYNRDLSHYTYFVHIHL